MTTTTCVTTREAAEHLHVHVRTIRKWIDTFKEYIRPQMNEQGHYILDDESLSRLQEIQTRLDSSMSMRQIKEELQQQALLPPSSSPFSDTLEATQQQLNRLSNDINNLEKHMRNLVSVYKHMENQFNSARQQMESINELRKMFSDMVIQQTQLKVEMRSMHFSYQLAVSAAEQIGLPSRQKKGRNLRIF